MKQIEKDCRPQYNKNLACIHKQKAKMEQDIRIRKALHQWLYDGVIAIIEDKKRLLYPGYLQSKKTTFKNNAI